MTHDLVAVVEAMYTTSLRSDEWMRRVAEATRPVLDRDGLGIVVGLYSCPDPCTFTPTAAFLSGLSDSVQALLLDGIRTFSPVFVADSFLSRSCYRGSEVRGWQDISTVRSGALLDAGIVDSIQINVVEPDGSGCWICCPLAHRTAIQDDAHITLTRLARHLAAAHRLRRTYGDKTLSPDCADAILDHEGGVRRARGAATEPIHQAALSRGARSQGMARSQSRSRAPSEAIEGWEPLIAGRWTLVDEVEGHGRRLLLAVDNQPRPTSIGLLSLREREVLIKALRGCANKVIASDLGLAQSTVRVLLARAAAKVGAGSRRELLAKTANLVGNESATDD